MKKTPVFLLLFMTQTFLFGQFQRWIYNYPNLYGDEAHSIAYGNDNNIYIAGALAYNGNYTHLAAISLTSSGGQRWVYQCSDPTNNNNLARSVAYGLDGNIYLAGYTSAASTWGGKFTVASLTSSGGQRWVWRDSSGQGFQVVCGPDTNIYAAGFLTVGGYWQYTVVSLDRSGGLRWLYRYSITPATYDGATTLAYGLDGNIYSGGYLDGMNGYFTVISLTNAGELRWMDTLRLGRVEDIAYGVDSNIYATGCKFDTFFVASMNDSGAWRWKYTDVQGWGYSIALDEKCNVFAVGETGYNDYGNMYLVSLDSAGAVRWSDTFSGPGNREDYALSVVHGADSNIYVGGQSNWNQSASDFTVISLSDSGSQRWIYHYPSTGSFNDQARSLVFGNDGNIYAAGFNWVSGYSINIFVVSLNPDINWGIENVGRTSTVVDRLTAATYQDRVISYGITSPAPTTVKMSLFDATGRQIAAWPDRVSAGRSRFARDLGRLAPGIFFLRAEMEEGCDDNRKIIIIK